MRKQSTTRPVRVLAAGVCLLLAAMLFAGCGQVSPSPAATTPAPATTAPTASPTEQPTPTPTEQPTATPEPTATVTPSSLGSGNSALIAEAGYVVGGWVGGQWADYTTFYGNLKDDMCSVYGTDGFVGKRQGSPYDKDSAEAGNGLYKLFTDDEAADRIEHPMVGVIGGEWIPANSFQYTVAPTDDALYGKLTQFLKDNGMAPGSKDEMITVFTADVYNDGKTESVLSATNMSDTTLEKGKKYYSCVLLIADDGVTVLSKTFADGNDANAYPEACICIGLMDLNNDGSLEVILNGEGAENGWTEVWSIKDGAWANVLNNSMGG